MPNFERELIDRGFRHFDVPPTGKKRDPRHWRGYWQKRIDDESGVRYFVNVEVMDFTTLPGLPNAGVRYEASVQFWRDGFDIELHHDPERTVDQMLAFFDRAWSAMACMHVG